MCSIGARHPESEATRGCLPVRSPRIRRSTVWDISQVSVPPQKCLLQRSCVSEVA